MRTNYVCCWLAAHTVCLSLVYDSCNAIPSSVGGLTNFIELTWTRIILQSAPYEVVTIFYLIDPMLTSFSLPVPVRIPVDIPADISSIPVRFPVRFPVHFPVYVPVSFQCVFQIPSVFPFGCHTNHTRGSRIIPNEKSRGSCSFHPSSRRRGPAE
jgi:hypothetical protein